MMIQRVTTMLVGVMLSGGITAAAAVARPTATSQQPQVQHLTCIQDTQGLMCNVDESSSTIGTEGTVPSADNSAPALITAAQLEQLSNLLLGIMYFGLPSALVFAVLRHDRREQEQTQLIAQLERIWHDPRS